MKGLKPIQLLTLLQVSIIPNIERSPDTGTQKAITDLLMEDFIMPTDITGRIDINSDELQLTVTKKGQVYLDALYAVPKPVVQWIIP